MDGDYSLERLQDKIQYPFSDRHLLEAACIRYKFLENHKTGSTDNMDPLATIGDAVLDLVVLKRLYGKGIRDRGILTKEKEKVIAKSNTRKLAEKYDYDKYVRWGDSESNDTIWVSADETFDRCIEALIEA